MSETTIKLDIVSAEEELFSAQVQMVFAPAMMGEVGISPKHTPLMTMLKAGDVRAQISETETKTFFISGGLLEIQPNSVTILSDTAIREDDLDEDRAKQAESNAREAMENSGSDMDLVTAKTALAQAAAQHKLITKLKGNR